MTLCIAAFANDRGDPKIVLCSDQLLGDEYHSTETEFKADVGFSDTLASLYAGPWADAEDLKRILRNHANSDSLTLNNYKKLLTDGLEEFKELIRGLRRDNTDAQCIIAGFVEDEAQIIRVDWEGVKVLPYFDAIGIGAYHADTVLSWRRMNQFSGLERTLYCVYEAKCFAELCKDVGHHTLIEVLSVNQQGEFKVDLVTQEGIDLLKEWFRRFGPQPIDLPERQFPKEFFHPI